MHTLEVPARVFKSAIEDLFWFCEVTVTGLEVLGTSRYMYIP